MKVEELYKLANYTIKKFHFIYSEDLVQEMVTDAYKASVNYDHDKGSWSNYCISCMKNTALRQIQESNRCKAIPSSKIERIDFDIVDNTSSGVKDIYNAIIDYVDPILVEHFLDGMTQKELALKYNCSQQSISKKIKKEILKIKEKLLDLGIYEDYKEYMNNIMRGE